MDNKDRLILAILKRNSREKYVNIAKKVNLTEGAIRQRITKLVKNGIIQRFTIDLGIVVEAIILVKTNLGKTKTIIQQLKTLSEKVYEVSGEYDIAVLVDAKDMDKLNLKIDDIRHLGGVIETNTLIRLL
jgi:DNA-binding Lrp family transcriptional regulator